MYPYDVALSFASESEALVQEVNYFLDAENIKTFFFPEQQKKLMSENPYQSIYKVFQKESLVKVLFVTDGYIKSKWTGMEKRRAVDSSKENHRRLVIVNYQGKKLDDELNIYIYLDGTILHTDEIASYIIERVRELKKGSGNTEYGRKADNAGRVRDKNVIIQNEGIIAGDYATFTNISF